MHCNVCCVLLRSLSPLCCSQSSAGNGAAGASGLATLEASDEGRKGTHRCTQPNNHACVCHFACECAVTSSSRRGLSFEGRGRHSAPDSHTLLQARPAVWTTICLASFGTDSRKRGGVSGCSPAHADRRHSWRPHPHPKLTKTTAWRKWLVNRKSRNVSGGFFVCCLDFLERG